MRIASGFGRIGPWVGCLTVLAATRGLVAQRTSDTGKAPPAWATVASRSGDLLYLEIGSRHGIRVGTPMELIRDGEVLGHMAAKYVSTSRTATVIIDTLISPVVGDSLRYSPVVDTEQAPLRTEISGTVQHRRSPPPVRGRVGVRYLMISQPGGTALRQPALDLRLTGNRIGGTSVGLSIDVRAQRTTLTGQGDGSPTSLTRVYQAAMNLQSSGATTRFTLGRQYATTLSPIGIFDGAAIELTGERWNIGLLAGTQPEAATFAPSRETTEFGAWLQRHNSPGGSSRWTATVGLVGSYHLGEINREFAYFRGTYATRALMIYAAQEVDANRGWRREVEGSATTLTSSFATARLTVSDPLTLSGGIDSRRSVRLYRDFLNPEIVFDDAIRQGYWGEIALRLGRDIRATTSIRQSTAGSAGGTETVTASVQASRLTPLQLGLRLRATRYTGPLSEGNLASAAIEVSPHRALRISLNAGQRSTVNPVSPDAALRLNWIGSDLDLAMSRSIYLMVSTYRESGPEAATIQNYLSLSWRF